MRSSTPARLTFAALACAALATLGGCGSSAHAPPLAGGTASTSSSPSPSPGTSSTASPTTSATPTATPTPAKGGTTTTGGVAKGKAADAAKKVAAAFIAGDNAATKTGTFSTRDKVTSPSCTWCATKKAAVLKIYRGGGHVEGELFTKNTFTATGPSKGIFTVVVNTTVSGYKELDGSGRVLDSGGNRRALLILRVGTTGGSPMVVDATWQPGD
jgi:hypothetical protein